MFGKQDMTFETKNIPDYIKTHFFHILRKIVKFSNFDPIIRGININVEDRIFFTKY